MLVSEFTLIFSFKGIGRWWGLLLVLYLQQGRRFPCCYLCHRKWRLVRMLIVWSNWGHFGCPLGIPVPGLSAEDALWHQSQLFLWGGCSPDATSCLWRPGDNMSWTMLQGVIQQRGVHRGKKFQILSRLHFTASKCIVRALRALMSLHGSVQPQELSPCQRLYLTSNLCLQSLHELCCRWTHLLGAVL